MKTRMMLEMKSDDKSKRTLSQIVKDTLQEEGPQGFFLGLKPYFIYSVSSYLVFFFSYETIKALTDAHTFGEIWLAGLSSGVITTLLTSPLSMVSNYIISAGKKEKRKLGYAEAIQEIHQKYGFQGFYTGLYFSLMLVINPTINMTVFEKLKVILPRVMEKNSALFLAGAISKLCATIATYPLTTVRTNMQSKPDVKALKVILFILKNFGPLGFYKGLQAKVMHSVLNSSLMLFLYERINEIVVKAVAGGA